jgi:hypothetical protein
MTFDIGNLLCKIFKFHIKMSKVQVELFQRISNWQDYLIFWKFSKYQIRLVFCSDEEREKRRDQAIEIMENYA